MPSAPVPADITRHIAELYADTQKCAAAAGLVYVSSEEPGISRRRHGKGFGYRSVDGARLTDEEVKARILSLAIPPAWQQVWICPSADGHILAIGEDDRGRKQYIYHEKWRALRDLLNSYRLIAFAEHLPQIRGHVQTQLRRRTLDRDQVLATLLRIFDLSAIRIGSEVYAEENESFGLTTLTKKHVQVSGSTVRLGFPAKSGKFADLLIEDRAVARIMSKLAASSSRRRVFSIDGKPIEGSEVNHLLFELTGEHITAKDFRTWLGTLAAFEHLAANASAAGNREHIIIEAVDAATEVLGNTRTVARAHYIHPHLLTSFLEGRFEGYLKQARPKKEPLLSGSEQKLEAFLKVLLEHEFQLDAA
jgi:DNA topoisomerase-1